MFKKADPKSLDFNVFSAIGDRWMLITAGTPEHCNTMTASWGGLGILWNLPTATAYVRPQRYTTFSGQLTAIVQAGESAGEIILTASAKGVKSGKISIDVE